MKINFLRLQHTGWRERDPEERPPGLHALYGWPEWLLAAIIVVAFFVGGGVAANLF